MRYVHARVPSQHTCACTKMKINDVSIASSSSSNISRYHSDQTDPHTHARGAGPGDAGGDDDEDGAESCSDGADEGVFGVLTPA